MGLLSGEEFSARMKVKQKLDKGITLTPEEQAVWSKHASWFAQYSPQPCGCGCGELLDDEPHEIFDGKEINADCYWNKLGTLVEQHPIIPMGIRRRA